MPRFEIRRLKPLLAASALALVGAVGWYLYDKPVTIMGGTQVSVDSVALDGSAVTGVHMVQSKEGQTEWTLDAERAQTISSEKRTRVDGPRLMVHLKDGNELVITALKGEVDNDGKWVVFRGNVVLVDKEQRRLTTEELWFDPGKRIMHTRLRFTFRGPDYQLEGVGMELHKDSRLLNVFNKVRFSYSEGAFAEKG